MLKHGLISNMNEKQKAMVNFSVLKNRVMGRKLPDQPVEKSTMFRLE